MYISRHLEQQVLEASRTYPVVMVCGQRQVGKSTMLHHLKETDRRYVTLDDFNARRLAEQDPALFFETYGAPLLIDEFQRVPSILLELKRIVDEKALNGEDAAGLYWLTGSQKFAMMKDVSESLAGRVAVLELSSLSRSEIAGCPPSLFSPTIDDLKQRVPLREKADVHQLFDEIYRGGMPKIVASDVASERYYADYINTYLEKDIKGYANIGKLHEFSDFLVYMAARTGQKLKYSEIAKAIGVSQPTAKEWVSILERSGILFLLRPYYNNITKRLVKTPKVYFMDTGLAAYLCRWPSGEVLEHGAMDGAFFETYVVSEIVKSYLNAGKTPDLYYYRDIDGKEIDLLIVEGDRFWPIEIKKSKAPKTPDKHFSVLEKLGLNVKPGVVLCMADELVPIDRSTWLCPAWVV